MTNQETIFPELDEAKKLEREITELHNDCKRILTKLPEYAKFVKLFGEYTTVLDGAQTDEADELVYKNVLFAIKQAQKLLESLNKVEEKLVQAEGKNDALTRVNRLIEEKNGKVFDERAPDTENMFENEV